MLFLLEQLNYESFGYRTIDIVLKWLRTLITTLLWASGLFTLLTVVLIFFRLQMPFGGFIASFVFFLVTMNLSLYFGLWHTRLTSRQIYILFEKTDRLVEKDREALIIRYIKISSLSAIISGINIMILILNNYVMALFNQLYVLADNQLRYGNWAITYKSLSPLIGNQFWNSVLMMPPAIISAYLLYNAYKHELVPYYDLMKQKIRRRFYQEKRISHLFDETLSLKEDVVVTYGVDSATHVPVVVNAEIMRLNTAMVGPIGSGKSAAFAKVVLTQLAEQFVKYLKAFHQFIENKNKLLKDTRVTDENEKQKIYDEWFEKGLGSIYTNGFYVNEPTGDLIRDTQTILERVGIPKEMIWLIDPTKEYTESINIFDADTTMAAGMTADLIRSFSEDGGSGGNTFFKNAESAYVKNLVVMLKTTARIEGNYLDKHLYGGNPTLSDFYKHLEDPELVVKRLKLLHVYVKAARRKYEKEYGEPYRDAYEKEKKEYLANGGFEPRFESKKSKKLKKLFEEKRIAENRVEIIEQTFNYFHNAYKVDPRTKIEYITHDANIEGMKNTIRKLASSELVRRIFFSPSTKDIDVLLKMGGFILVSTARGPIDDDTSRMIGQITDMIVQKAVFRRNSSTKDAFFALMEDEYGWVTTANTERFLNQNRKYNTGVFGLYQNYEQIEADLGKAKADALFNSYRNLFAFQGGSKRTLEQIVERAGNSLELTRMRNQNNENLLAGNDNNSTSIREQLEEKDVTSSSDLFRMEQFQFAGVIVKDDEESEFMQVTPTPSFKTDIFKDEGINYHRKFDIDNNESDREAFETWKEQTERRYKLRFYEERIGRDIFTAEELRIIDGLDEEDAFSQSESEDTKPTKPTLNFNSNKEKTVAEKTRDEAAVMVRRISEQQDKKSSDRDLFPNCESTILKQDESETKDRVSHEHSEEIETVSSDGEGSIRQGTVNESVFDFSILDDEAMPF